VVDAGEGAGVGTEQVDLAELSRTGTWATGTTTLRRLQGHARLLDWEKVTTRKGDSAVTELRPTTAEEASPSSLSAVCGLGEQPLHTDGAHMPEPPDVVVLYGEEPNNTPTLLWSLSSPLTNPDHPTIRGESSRQGGLFLVRSGIDRFLASAHADGRYRYDPICMTPCDERAREVARYFREVQGKAHRYEWVKPGQVLLINNRNALHARAAVSESDVDRVLTRIAYHCPKAMQ